MLACFLSCMLGCSSGMLTSCGCGTAPVGGTSAGDTSARERAVSPPKKMSAPLPFMDTRLTMVHLHGKRHVGSGYVVVLVVVQYRQACRRRLLNPHGVLDDDIEHLAGEVGPKLGENLVGMGGAPIEHRGQNSSDLEISIQPRLDLVECA